MESLESTPVHSIPSGFLSGIPFFPGVFSPTPGLARKRAVSRRAWPFPIYRASEWGAVLQAGGAGGDAPRHGTCGTIRASLTGGRTGRPRI